MSYKKVQVWVHTLSSVGRRWLLLKTIPSRGSFWQPVTGKVEANELLGHAALREAIEETACDFKTEPFAIGYDFNFRGRWGDAHETVFILELPSLQGHLPLVKLDAQSHLEHEEYRWCVADEVESLVAFESNREAFRRTVQFLNK